MRTGGVGRLALHQHAVQPVQPDQRGVILPEVGNFLVGQHKIEITDLVPVTAEQVRVSIPRGAGITAERIVGGRVRRTALDALQESDSGRRDVVLRHHVMLQTKSAVLS
ncbi:hypothetical protein GCM10010116_32410 [Microbispora rosea subsp. aerata]|nr:hypothetical protein GCM10010116_32410 [Microbispora rosea subsp. aerata]GIH55845.1 hypothetical protein Mro02_27590 [Microbispora rosea subsp. aerata]GLJ83241.1 hypothetical protein GCM10017588_19680 [Microbispora rosea subsp. aerata]